MGLPIVLNIQRFSLNDGEGIRTTVFFKGCSLHCLWCHNPEGQSFSSELMFFPERCRACGSCAEACPEGAISVSAGKLATDRSKCTACGRCVSVCAYDARATVGEYMDIDKLVSICVRDMMQYEVSHGGVTLSGGEVMQQDMGYVAELMRKLVKKGVSVYIDTSGLAPWENFERVLPYCSCFLYDIKHMDDAAHIKYTGVSNYLILENLMRLSESGANIHIRIPVIGGVNDTDENMRAIIAFLREKVKVSRVSLLPYHAIGSDKYLRLGKPATKETFTVPSSERMNELKSIFEASGFTDISIGG